MTDTPAAPGPIDDLIPGPDYLIPMWFGCLSYSIGEPVVVAAFRADTGVAWSPGATPLMQAIDRASGAELEFVRAFITWFNANVWGELDTTEEAAAR